MSRRPYPHRGEGYSSAVSSAAPLLKYPRISRPDTKGALFSTTHHCISWAAAPAVKAETPKPAVRKKAPAPAVKAETPKPAVRKKKEK